MTNRADVVDGTAADGFAGVPGCHPPNALSTSGFNSAAVMLPATTSAALFATKFFFQNATMSSRDVAWIDASVPSSVKP